MDFQASEDAIIERLAPLVTAGCEVIPLPDSQDQAKRPITKPRITVLWNNSDSDRSQSTGNIIQSSTVTFEIAIQWKRKRGDTGIYMLMKLIKIYLLGFESNFFGKLWVTKEEFVDYNDENIWSYRMYFSAIQLEVETGTDEADIILSQVNFNTEAI